MLCLFRKIAGAMWILGQTFFLRAAARSFAWFRLCCVILPFGFPFVISGACLGGSVLSVDYRSEGMLIQFPPGRGRRPCRFNSESETRVSVFFLYGFSLIVRLVREVIKITRGVLARVFFWGFGGWNRGHFCGFWSILRKCVGAVCLGCLAVSLWCVVGFGAGVGTFALRGRGFIWVRV